MSDRESRPRNVALSLLWGGQVLSLLGSAAASFALSLVVYTETGSALALSLTLAARFATSVFLAPFAGTLADHFDRKRFIVAADVVLALCSFALALLALGVGDRAFFALVLAVLAIAGFADACLSVTLTATVRQLRTEANLTRVNGLLSLLESMPSVAGPILGAILVSFLAPSVVFLLDGATFVVAAIATMLAPWRARATLGGRRLRPFHGAREGLRYIWSDPGFRTLQLSFAGFNFTAGLASAAIIAYVLDSSTPDLAPANLAAYNAAGAIGLVAGAVLVFALGSRLPRRGAIGGSAVVSGAIGRVLLATTSAPALWPITNAVRGASIQVNNALLTAVWQEQVPQDRQGAVFGARRLLGQGPYPLALLAGGLLADSVFSQGAPIVTFLGSHIERLSEPGGGVGLYLVILGVAEVAIGLWIISSGRIRDLLSRPHGEPTV